MDTGIEHAIEKYLDAADTGRAPDRDEFMARHPAHRKGLQGFFRDFDEVERLCALIRTMAGTRVPGTRRGRIS